MAQLHLQDLQSADRKRLPKYPVPAVRIARLAVSHVEQGKSYGSLLLGHVMNCSMLLRTQLGVRVVIVDALDVQAANFYRKYGFRSASDDALTLYLSQGKSRIVACAGNLNTLGRKEQEGSVPYGSNPRFPCTIEKCDPLVDQQSSAPIFQLLPSLLSKTPHSIS